MRGQKREDRSERTEARGQIGWGPVGLMVFSGSLRYWVDSCRSMVDGFFLGSRQFGVGGFVLPITRLLFVVVLFYCGREPAA